MRTLHLVGESYSLFIMQDLFSNLNIVIMVVHEDPNQAVETFIVPISMLQVVTAVKHAAS